MKKLFLLAALSISAAALAETAQDVIKKAYADAGYSRYATADLKKWRIQAVWVAEKVDTDMGCELFEHYDLGIGNGGAPDDLLKTLKVKPLKGNVYRASFKGLDGKRSGADITVVCQSGKCLIDDVGGIKAYYKQVVKTRSCD